MLNSILHLRALVARHLKLTDAHRMLLWAVVVGFLGALATIVFRDAIRALQWLVDGRSGSLVALATSLPWQARLVSPALGGVIAGLVLIGAKRLSSRASSDYMEAIAIGDGRIPVRFNLLRSFSSLITIVSGGSIGREGSMVQLAATAASVVGRLTHFDPVRLRLLVACGGAAGITSAYNAPIAGALFVTEIVLGSFAMDSFGPLVVASVVANITMRQFPGYAAPYEMPPFPAIAGSGVFLYVGLGIFAGIIAPLYLLLLEQSKKAFTRTDWPLPWRLGVGGLVVGVLSVWQPGVWGNGFSVVNSLLHDPWTWSSVLVLLIMKVLATAATTGSGAVGGVFTPTLFVGAALGTLFGHGMNAVAIGAPAIFPFTIVGMGAFLAAAAGAPLMAIMMIFEMTLSYEVMLPLMLASVVAYFVARLIGDHSMYEITMKRMREADERTRLRETQMQALMKPAETVLDIDAPFADVTAMFVKYPVKFLYVVDHDKRFVGAIALHDVTAMMLDADTSHAGTIAALTHKEFPVLTADMGLSDALHLFLTHPGERLPVLQSTDDRHLLGAVYKSVLLDTYVRLSSPEMADSHA